MSEELNKAVERLRERLLEAATDRNGREIYLGTGYGSGDPELADDIARAVGKYWDE